MSHEGAGKRTGIGEAGKVRPALVRARRRPIADQGAETGKAP